jgi:glutamyl-tRNA(Gln) amidotransferase subunit E
VATTSADEGSVKVGLEIHQQVDSGKLFCRCPSDLEEAVSGSFVRRLRATKSELGEVDKAALAEAQKGLAFRYEVTPKSSCLVDADEEPPRPMNADAFDVALALAQLSNMEVVDEVHVMRKIVVDGSNTTGFQRTALVASGGALPMPDGTKVALQSLCLEEDSARETGEGSGERVFRLDRLGIPLIEIATAPDIRSADEAQAVAARIGALMRATRRVKRGQGTIRQDVNISVDGGARVELKGVQDLRAIPEVVRTEERRQRALNRAARELAARGVGQSDIRFHTADLTDLLAGTRARIVSRVLREGGRVWGARLSGFAGTLGDTLSGQPGVRVLGPEFSQRVRAVGLGGTMHTEEGDLVEKYGFTRDEVEAVLGRLEVGERDVMVMVAGPEERLRHGLASLEERARMALNGAVSEVRAANEDATSRYLRPMPGAARMYPETDLPPVGVTSAALDRVRAGLPPLPEERAKEVEGRTGVSGALVDQLDQTDRLADFDEVALDVAKAGAEAAATNAAVARLLLTTVAQAERDGDALWPAHREALVRVRDLLHAGSLAKEGAPAVLAAVLLEGKPLEEALAALAAPSHDDARDQIRKLVAEKADLVREKGEGAHGPLMGLAMKELRGKVDGKVIAGWLQEEIEALLARVAEDR